MCLRTHKRSPFVSDHTNLAASEVWAPFLRRLRPVRSRKGITRTLEQTLNSTTRGLSFILTFGADTCRIALRWTANRLQGARGGASEARGAWLVSDSLARQSPLQGMPPVPAQNRCWALARAETCPLFICCCNLLSFGPGVESDVMKSTERGAMISAGPLAFKHFAKKRGSTFALICQCQKMLSQSGVATR